MVSIVPPPRKENYKTKEEYEKAKKEWEKAVIKSKFGGIVLDDDYIDGVASNLAYQLIKKTKKNFEVMGLKDRSAGFSKTTDNLPPSKEEIIKKCKEIIYKKGKL